MIYITITIYYVAGKFNIKHHNNVVYHKSQYRHLKSVDNGKTYQAADYVFLTSDDPCVCYVLWKKQNLTKLRSLILKNNETDILSVVNYQLQSIASNLTYDLLKSLYSFQLKRDMLENICWAWMASNGFSTEVKVVIFFNFLLHQINDSPKRGFYLDDNKNLVPSNAAKDNVIIVLKKILSMSSINVDKMSTTELVKKTGLDDVFHKFFINNFDKYVTQIIIEYVPKETMDNMIINVSQIGFFLWAMLRRHDSAKKFDDDIDKIVEKIYCPFQPVNAFLKQSILLSQEQKDINDLQKQSNKLKMKKDVNNKNITDIYKKINVYNNNKKHPNGYKIYFCWLCGSWFPLLVSNNQNPTVCPCCCEIYIHKVGWNTKMLYDDKEFLSNNGLYNTVWKHYPYEVETTDTILDLVRTHMKNYIKENNLKFKDPNRFQQMMRDAVRQIMCKKIFKHLETKKSSKEYNKEFKQFGINEDVYRFLVKNGYFVKDDAKNEHVFCSCMYINLPPETCTRPHCLFGCVSCLKESEFPNKKQFGRCDKHWDEYKQEIKNRPRGTGKLYHRHTPRSSNVSPFLLTPCSGCGETKDPNFIANDNGRMGNKVWGICDCGEIRYNGNPIKFPEYYCEGKHCLPFGLSYLTQTIYNGDSPMCPYCRRDVKSPQVEKIKEEIEKKEDSYIVKLNKEKDKLKLKRKELEEEHNENLKNIQNLKEVQSKRQNDLLNNTVFEKDMKLASDPKCRGCNVKSYNPYCDECIKQAEEKIIEYEEMAAKKQPLPDGVKIIYNYDIPDVYCKKWQNDCKHSSTINNSLFFNRNSKKEFLDDLKNLIEDFRICKSEKLGYEIRTNKDLWPSFYNDDPLPIVAYDRFLFYGAYTVINTIMMNLYIPNNDEIEYKQVTTLMVIFPGWTPQYLEYKCFADKQLSFQQVAEYFINGKLKIKNHVQLTEEESLIQQDANLRIYLLETEDDSVEMDTDIFDLVRYDPNWKTKLESYSLSNYLHIYKTVGRDGIVKAIEKKNE